MHTYMHTCTHAQSHYSTVKEVRLKITANYFVCTVAQLPGSPEAAVIDLSSPFLQHVILSLLPLSGVCQRDQVAIQKIVAPLSNLTSEHNCAALMNIVIPSKTTNLLILSQMSISLSPLWQLIFNAHVKIASILLIWIKMKSKSKAFKAKCLWYKDWNIILVAELLPQVCRESQAEISSDDNKKTFDLITFLILLIPMGNFVIRTT